jgi:hypothetical protein
MYIMLDPTLIAGPALSLRDEVKVDVVVKVHTGCITAYHTCKSRRDAV